MPTVTSADGTTIAYETQGSGPALILVDGAMCYRDFGPARALANAFATNHTVHIYDRRGRGQAATPSPGAPTARSTTCKPCSPRPAARRT